MEANRRCFGKQAIGVFLRGGLDKWNRIGTVGEIGVLAPAVFSSVAATWRGPRQPILPVGRLRELMADFVSSAFRTLSETLT